MTHNPLRAIAESARELIFSCTLDGRVLYANSAMQTASGLTADDNILERIHPDYLDDFRRALTTSESLGPAETALKVAGADFCF